MICSSSLHLYGETSPLRCLSHAISEGREVFSIYFGSARANSALILSESQVRDLHTFLSALVGEIEKREETPEGQKDWIKLDGSLGK